ncbi:MAG: S-adenosylmethionine:tRNA ribosyltransferase-isomerase [Bacteroidota bacterium]
MALKLDEFTYDLPEERIAKHPPEKRGASKLLHFQQGKITHHHFAEIPKLLPQNSLLVFNDTKVIPARVIMHKESGARIEIFLLEPLKPSQVHEEVMNVKHSCTWKCMIGNAKKWPIGGQLAHPSIPLSAKRISQDEVSFEWSNELSFSDVLAEIGKVPLPPYIDRDVNEDDPERYQTVYSKMEGAVAAPTAGLHFTDEIIQLVQQNKISTDFLTLHVSAGTFQPIKTTAITDHKMHNEQIWISRKNIENLLSYKPIIAVGTTSMRTLESVYWFGAKILSGVNDFFISQTDASTLPSPKKDEALKAVLSYMDGQDLDRISGHTEIYIYPGYDFKICDGLVTNFHLPGSTLILLIAAFIGDDWRRVYQEAIENGYQFLSYGDSSLLLKQK